MRAAGLHRGRVLPVPEKQRPACQRGVGGAADGPRRPAVARTPRARFMHADDLMQYCCAALVAMLSSKVEARKYGQWAVDTLLNLHRTALRNAGDCPSPAGLRRPTAASAVYLHLHTASKGCGVASVSICVGGLCGWGQ